MENMAFVLSTYLPPLDKFNMYWAEGGRGSLGASVFLRKGSLCAPLPVLGWILTVREGMTKQKERNKQKRCLRDLKTEPIYVLLSRWSERWQVLGKNPHTQHGTETVQYSRQIAHLGREGLRQPQKVPCGLHGRRVAGWWSCPRWGLEKEVSERQRGNSHHGCSPTKSHMGPRMTRKIHLEMTKDQLNTPLLVNPGPSRTQTQLQTVK